MRKLFILLVVLLISAFLVSCAGEETTAPTTGVSSTTTVPTSSTPTVPAGSTSVHTKPPEATGQPQYGGIMRIITSGLPTNIGAPGVAMGPPEQILMCVEPLTSFDEDGNLVPQLATSWDMDPVAKTITLHLRKGVKFHDGTDFNAEACKWNFDERQKAGRTSYVNVESMDILDDHTLRITFKQWNALNIITFTHTVMMYSPTAVKTNGDEWAKEHCVGTGPFKQTDYKNTSYWKLTRFDDYWGPKPYLDGIEYVVVADSTVAALTMQRGDADMWKTGATNKDCYDLSQLGFNVIVRQSGNSFLCWDSATPGSPFAKQQVREAVEYALDRPAMAKALGYGFLKPLTQFATEMDLPYIPEIKGRPYDPAKAKQLLAEAGYPNGFQTKIYIRGQAAIDGATLLQSYLAQVGINIDIDVCDNARWLSYTGRDNWKDGILLCFWGRNAGYSYIEFSLGTFFKIQEGAAYQVIAKSQEFADLYNQLMKVQTLEDSVDIGKKMVQQIYDECMVVPLYASNYSVITQKWVHTNYLNVHHQIWNAELDWMESH
jgi:peptide/nickel transport system substrate-binding protein